MKNIRFDILATILLSLALGYMIGDDIFTLKPPPELPVGRTYDVCNNSEEDQFVVAGMGDELREKGYYDITITLSLRMPPHECKRFTYDGGYWTTGSIPNCSKAKCVTLPQLPEGK